VKKKGGIWFWYKGCEKEREEGGKDKKRLLSTDQFNKSAYGGRGGSMLERGKGYRKTYTI